MSPAEHHPDLLWIDPALAYLGGEANAQVDVGAFLRGGLNPLLREFGCGAIVIHHTNKPAIGTESTARSAGDAAYLGAGSAEWANWARAILAIRGTRDSDTFELRAAKRGKRLHWKTDAGSPSLTKAIVHSSTPGRIHWREVTGEELEAPPGKVFKPKRDRPPATAADPPMCTDVCARPHSLGALAARIISECTYPSADRILCGHLGLRLSDMSHSRQGRGAWMGKTLRAQPDVSLLFSRTNRVG